MDSHRQEVDVQVGHVTAPLPYCRAKHRGRSPVGPSRGRTDPPLTHLPAPQMAKTLTHCSLRHSDGGHKECVAWRQEVLAFKGPVLCQTQAFPPDREAGALVSFCPSSLGHLGARL